MTLFGVDWDGKAIHVSEDGDPANVTKLKDQFALLEALNERPGGPHVVVLEAPFEAYDRERHQRTLDAFSASSVLLRTISPRSTAHRRRELGWEKTDPNDAAAIWRIADGRGVANLHIPAPQLLPDDPWAKLRDDAEHELMVLRRTGRKTLLWRELKKHLPKFRDLSPEAQLALGGKDYSAAILPAVYVAAKHTSNIDDWERLIGLYESGRPGQFRSDIYHHGWRGTMKPYFRKRDAGLTLSAYRRNLRHLYRQVKNLEVAI